MMSQVQAAGRRGALCYSARPCLHAAMTASPNDTSPAEPDPRHADAMAAPPPDVQSLLDSEAGALTLYFDAQRAMACARSQRDWPQLWRLAAAAE